MAEVTSLSWVGRSWFGRRTPNSTTVQDFLVASEQLRPSGWGIELQSLPRPWDQVVIFLKKYITCEGRYQSVYYYEFPLMSHLRHINLINVPFFLFKDLHHMAGFFRSAKHPYSSLTHHGLIKILILRALAQRNQTWDQFIGQPQIARGPIPLPEIPIREVRAPTLLLNVQLEEYQKDQSPSNLVGRGS